MSYLYLRVTEDLSYTSNSTTLYRVNKTNVSVSVNGAAGGHGPGVDRAVTAVCILRSAFDNVDHDTVMIRCVQSKYQVLKVNALVHDRDTASAPSAAGPSHPTRISTSSHPLGSCRTAQTIVAVLHDEREMEIINQTALESNVRQGQ